MTDWELPTRGVVFWPVGNGDSTTIVVDENTVIQVDLCQYDASQKEDDPRVPVVDRLAEILPRADDGKTPRLTVLAISHHDRDHCSGFDEMCGDGFQVDEMWLTLRSFVEDKDSDEGLTTEGQMVYDEAKRRRDAEIKAAKAGKRAAPGDRLRIIGREDLLGDDHWKDFPLELVTRAGSLVPSIDGEDRSDLIEVFIHTPFREPDGDDDRNSSSLGMRVTLKDADCEKRFLILGDLDHKKVEAFVQKTIARGNEDYLPWDFLLAPHHGSRKAIMKEEGDSWVKAEAYFSLEEHMGDGAQIIISARSLDDISDGNSDPPHEDAIRAYKDMAGKDNVVLTADYAKGNDSEPITIEVTSAACGERRESKRAFAARIGSMTKLAGATRIRRGDSQGATGDQEFA